MEYWSSLFSKCLGLLYTRHILGYFFFKKIFLCPDNISYSWTSPGSGTKLSTRAPPSPQGSSRSVFIYSNQNTLRKKTERTQKKKKLSLSKSLFRKHLLFAKSKPASTLTIPEASLTPCAYSDIQTASQG